MKRVPSLALAVGLAVVAGAAAFPLLGWIGMVEVAATAFYVVALVGSGYRVTRAIAWGALVGLLFAVGNRGSGPSATLSTAAATALFFAAVLLPSFRGWWFGQAIE